MKVLKKKVILILNLVLGLAI